MSRRDVQKGRSSSRFDRGVKETAAQSRDGSQIDVIALSAVHQVGISMLHVCTTNPVRLIRDFQ